MPVQMDYTSKFAYDDGITTFMIGDTVYVNGEGDYRGKVCYIGEVHFAKGEFAGISLDHPLGNHDGAHRGRRYFQCEPNHGVFARVGKIAKIPLIPATNDSERCGLYRMSPTQVRRRSSSGARSSGSGTDSSFVKEGSPYSSYYYSSSAGSSVRSFSKSPSPSPTPTTSSSGSGGLTYTYNLLGRNRNSSGGSGMWTNNSLKVGDRVIVASSIGETKTGVLRYLGPVEFASGEYAGIELFHPLGKNDGTVRGRHYFSCRHPFGLFVPSYKVETSPANKLSTNVLGTKDNVHRILQYGSRVYGRGARAGSYDEDFY